MQDLPKISIITITYNSAQTIERTINSVIAQDYKNLEYIIIDGLSTDQTQNIIKKYIDKLAYWISEKDNGISDAFNKGLKQAKGDMFFASDFSPLLQNFFPSMRVGNFIHPAA